MVVGISRSSFCIEFVELTLLILNNFRLFGFGAWGKSYSVYKPKLWVFDRHPVKMASHHVVMAFRLINAVTLAPGTKTKKKII